MKRNPRYTAGANAERSAIIAKVRRMKKVYQGVEIVEAEVLLGWLLERHMRYNKRKGGIGR